MPTTDKARKLAKDLRKVYGVAGKCDVCKGLIRPGQTWKFTPEGARVHKYCARENPTGDIRTLTQGLFEHAERPTGTIRKVAEAEVRNEHGVLETYTVYTNRTRNRWWLEKLVGEKPDPSWDWSERAKHAFRQTLFYSFATSSPRKAEEWVGAVNKLRDGETNPFTLDPRYVLRHGTVMLPPSRGRTRPGARPTTTAAAVSGGTYRGARIWKDGEGWHASLDPESVFDSYRDAKAFVDVQARNPRRRIVDEVLEEHIRMPGMPGLIVTRGFALQWWGEQGWAGPKQGIGSLDHYVMLPKPVDEPLTDPELRDYNLEGMARSLSQANPNLGSRKEFEALGYRLGQSRGQQDRRSEELGVIRPLGLEDIRVQAQWYVDNQLVYQPGYNAKWGQAVVDKFVSGYYAGYSGRRQRRTA